MGREEFIDISGIEAVRPGQGTEEIMQNPMSYARYAQILNGLKRRLEVGSPIPNDVNISIVGNNTILSSALTLRSTDFEPLEAVTQPGKSCHIEHTSSVAIACLTMFGRVAKREDHLYRLTPSELRAIGLTPVYAPTVRRPLHVRLVPARLKHNDIPEEIKQAFANIINDGNHEISQEPTRHGIRRG